VRKGRRARSRTRSQRRNDRSWLGRSYFNPIPAALYCTPRHPQTLRREGGKRAQTSSTTPTLPGAAQTERRGIRMQLAPRLWCCRCRARLLGSAVGRVYRSMFIFCRAVVRPLFRNKCPSCFWAPRFVYRFFFCTQICSLFVRDCSFF
jgi:hypothetical protein